MSEAEAQSNKKKRTKKKKKSLSEKQNTNETEKPQPDLENGIGNLTEILPQKVGMKTIIKDVEVTMTENNLQSHTPESNTKSSKKKKKKKTTKQTPASLNGQTLNSLEEKTINKVSLPKATINDKGLTIISESNNEKKMQLDDMKISADLLHFIDGGRSLLNNPEISVTVAEKVPLVSPNPIITSPNENISSLNSEISNTKSKKKKKKKKKSNSTPDNPIATNNSDGAITEPTYIKLPADKDTCVLVVSHENFANGKKNENNKQSDKVINDKKSENNNSLEGNGSKEIITLRNLKIKENVVSLYPANVNKVDQNKLYALKPEYEVQSNISENTASNSKMDIKEKSPLLKENAKSNSVENSNLKPTNISNSLSIDKESVSSNKEVAQLSKAQLKAERRAKQEAQRAAKAVKSLTKMPDTTNSSEKTSSNTQNDNSMIKSNVLDAKIKSYKENKIEKDQPYKIRLFSHLPQFEYKEIFSKHITSESKIHPDILEIGAQYSKGIICGSNARCIALLNALKNVVIDYQKPPDKEFSRDLEALVQSYMIFLDNCRPLSVSMINSVKFLKHQINHLPKDKNDEFLKQMLSDFIDNFVREEILLAKEAIGDYAAAKIVDGDVILVFAYSSLVKEVLCKAFHQNKVFRVIVLDSRPKKEALGMLQSLVKEGINCSYGLITSAAYVMKEVSKVIIGAHALLSNGYVMSRVGSSQIALVASSFGVPVLVCCETYKFCERALTDSFVHNELGDPNELCIHMDNGTESNILNTEKGLSSLQLLNLLYDVTPPDLISMVITEKGVLPCTSVPVVLRVRHAGLHEQK